jgi:hypothetical protein
MNLQVGRSACVYLFDMTTQSDLIASITDSLLSVLSCTEGTHTLHRIDHFVHQCAELEESIAKDTGNPDKNVRQGGPALNGEFAKSDFIDGLQYAGFFGYDEE